MVDVFFLHQNMDLYCSSTMQILDQNNIFFFKYFVNIHFSGLRQYKEKSNKCTLNLIDFIVLIYSNQIICWEHYRYIQHFSTSTSWKSEFVTMHCKRSYDEEQNFWTSSIHCILIGILKSQSISDTVSILSV